MKKGTLFLSAVLTTFLLAVMVGAVSAYQKASEVSSLSGQQAAVQLDPSLVGQPDQNPSTGDNSGASLSPEQAAALAAQVIGRTDLYSVETADFEGQSVYLVTFSSGDLVYVSPEGQILSISSIPPIVVTAPPADQDGGFSFKSYDDHDDDHESEDHDSGEHDDD